MRPNIAPFAIAGTISAVLYAGYTFFTEQSGLQGPGYAVLLLMVGAQFSFLAIVVLALPTYIVFSRLRLFKLWSSLAAGLVFGATMAAITEWPQTGLRSFVDVGWSDHAVRRIFVYAAIGAVAGLGFWLAWKQGREKTREVQSRRAI
jgi:hypothetical protein